MDVGPGMLSYQEMKEFPQPVLGFLLCVGIQFPISFSMGVPSFYSRVEVNRTQARCQLSVFQGLQKIGWDPSAGAREHWLHIGLASGARDTH